MVNANEFLDLFIDLIRELEVIPRDRFYRIRIKLHIKKLRGKYLKALKKKKSFTVKDMLNFTVLLNTVKNMKIIDNFEISENDINLYTKINQVDILFTGIYIYLVTLEGGKPNVIFTLKTKQLQDNQIYMDLRLEVHNKGIAEYGAECDKNTSHNFNDILELLENNYSEKMSEGNIDKLNICFKFLKNIFSMYYNYLFDELERKYLQ